MDQPTGRCETCGFDLAGAGQSGLPAEIIERLHRRWRAMSDDERTDLRDALRDPARYDAGWPFMGDVGGQAPLIPDDQMPF